MNVWEPKREKRGEGPSRDQSGVAPGDSYASECVEVRSERSEDCDWEGQEGLGRNGGSDRGSRSRSYSECCQEMTGVAVPGIGSGEGRRVQECVPESVR